MSQSNEIQTFGDARRMLLRTILAIKNGEISNSSALVIAATMKEVNHNVQCEINAAKASILARDKGMDFGEVVRMGQRVIGTIAGVEGDQK